MLWWLIGFYIALLLYAVLLSDRVIFQPPHSSYRDDGRIVKLASRDGARISALYLENPQARYTILYSHGNAEDMGHNLDYFQEFVRQGFSVFAYDYQGYGTSEGRPSERNAYADAEAAYQYLVAVKRVPPERIIAVGQSLGGAMAVDLAARHKLGGLVVQSSFASAFRVLTRWPVLPFDKFNSLGRIQRVQCPVLIIHGKADSVIGFWNAKLLYDAAPAPKQKWWVDRGGHNDILFVDAPGYWKALRQFVATLR